MYEAARQHLNQPIEGQPVCMTESECNTYLSRIARILF